MHLHLCEREAYDSERGLSTDGCWRRCGGRIRTDPDDFGPVSDCGGSPVHRDCRGGFEDFGEAHCLPQVQEKIGRVDSRVGPPDSPAPHSGSTGEICDRSRTHAQFGFSQLCSGKRRSRPGYAAPTARLVPGPRVSPEAERFSNELRIVVAALLLSAISAPAGADSQRGRCRSPGRQGGQTGLRTGNGPNMPGKGFPPGIGRCPSCGRRTATGGTGLSVRVPPALFQERDSAPAGRAAAIRRPARLRTKEAVAGAGEVLNHTQPGGGNQFPGGDGIAGLRYACDCFPVGSSSGNRGTRPNGLYCIRRQGHRPRASEG